MLKLNLRFLSSKLCTKSVHFYRIFSYYASIILFCGAPFLLWIIRVHISSPLYIFGKKSDLILDNKEGVDAKALIANGEDHHNNIQIVINALEVGTADFQYFQGLLY